MPKRQTKEKPKQLNPLTTTHVEHDAFAGGQLERSFGLIFVLSKIHMSV